MKKTISVLLCFLLLLPLAGCWNYRGLNELTIVAGMSIDKDNGKYQLGFEIMDLQKPTKTQGISSKMIYSEGDSVFDAIRNAKNQLSSRLYFGNTQIVIISEQIAREDGLNAMMDFFLRDSEMRETIEMIVSQESTAKELLMSDEEVASAVSYNIIRIIRDDSRLVGATVSAPLYHIYGKLKSPGISSTLPLFSIPEDPHSHEKTARANGIAVFRDDKLAGFLSTEETKYFLMADNMLHGGLLTVYVPELTQQNITLEMSGTSCDRKIQEEEGALSVHLQVSVKAYLAEYPHKSNHGNQPAITAIERAAEKLVEEKLSSLMKDSQTEYQADILGIGNTVYKTNLPLWKKIGKDWANQYQTLPITVSAKVSITNTVMMRQN